jgi:hypothetical protein
MWFWKRKEKGGVVPSPYNVADSQRAMDLANEWSRTTTLSPEEWVRMFGRLKTMVELSHSMGKDHNCVSMGID